MTTIPDNLIQAFTMNGTVPVSYTSEKKQIPSIPFTTGQIDQYIAMAKAGRSQSLTDTYLYQALSRHPVAGQTVGVLGSTTPWYESVLLAEGATPVTMAPIASEDPRIATVQQVEKPFDALFSLFYLKSLGLGSTLDPNADLDAMKQAKSYLKPGGLLYLSVPLGKDRLVWNSHRIYGEFRLKALLKGWRPVAYLGYTYEDLLKDNPRLHEPVIVLKPVYTERVSKFGIRLL